MAVKMMSEYARPHGVTNTLIADVEDIRNITVEGGKVRLIFRGGVNDVQAAGFVPTDVVRSDYISKEDLVNLLGTRRETYISRAVRYGADGKYEEAHNATLYAREIDRIIRDVEIDEINIP